MIKIKLHELHIHRNETTFRPLLAAQATFNEIGVQVVDNGPCDLNIVAQASIINKKTSLDNSVNNGLEFLKTIDGPYVILDGQDSTSVIGTYEVFKNI